MLGFSSFSQASFSSLGITSLGALRIFDLCGVTMRKELIEIQPVPNVTIE